ncbi:MAG: GAF domain-containing protein [Chloroflexota bacterium]
MRFRLFPLVSFLLGLLFPIGSFLILAFENNLPLGSFAAVLNSLAKAHQLDKVQWLMDAIPIIMGLLGYWVSARLPQISALEAALETAQGQKEELSNQVESIQASLQQRIETATTQLRSAAELAQQANLIRQPEELMEQIVELISDRLGFYHVGIFLNDRENRYTVLQAANSPGGRRMLARRHRLAIGEMGIVGYVARQGEARLALDVGQDAVYFDNPDLPDTRSEMALPLRIASKRAQPAPTPVQPAEMQGMQSAGGAATSFSSATNVIGVLDIQSTQSQAFDESDLVVAQIIADSLANAIENARLFAEVQANLEEIRELHRQYMQRASWLGLASGDSLEYTFQAEHLNARRTSEPEIEKSEKRTLEAPIRLREQSIGKILLEAAPRQEAGQAALEWLPEELAMVEAITTQAGLALENARLLQETQRRAEQERLAAEIAARLWASGDPNTILRTTLKELADALGASDGMIQLEVRE